MDTEKVGTGVKVFGGVLMAVCAALVVWFMATHLNGKDDAPVTHDAAVVG